MADSLGRAVLTLTVDDKQYNAGLKAAKDNADKFGDAVKGAVGGTAGQGVGQLAGGFAALSGGVAVAAAAVVAAGAAIAGIGYVATQSAGQIQKLNAAFTGLTGSAEAARQLRQDLFTLSKTTPFKNEEILQAAQQFLAVGIPVEKLQGSINRLGAIAAQSGQPLSRLALIYAQVYAKGRLQGEENLQLLEAGVDLTQELAQVTGLSGTALQDAMSKGKISVANVNAAIKLATGEMTALELAGKSVDTQFNNIFDNAGQLFGGFATAIAPALSAAFKVINDIFDEAFPSLEDLTKLFQPLTDAATTFADTLGGNRELVVLFADALKTNLKLGVDILAQAFGYLNDILRKTDAKRVSQAFINLEFSIRAAFNAAVALGAQLAKNAELSFRALDNPLAFGKSIIASGGIGKFLEKEFAGVSQLWQNWLNTNPLEFPDLAGQAAKQAESLQGELSDKNQNLQKSAAEINAASEKLAEAARQVADRFTSAVEALTNARLNLAERKADPQGLNRFLRPDETFQRTRQAIIGLGSEFKTALDQGQKLLNAQGVGLGRPVFQDLTNIFDAAVTGQSATQEGLQQIIKFIQDVKAEQQAIRGVNTAEENLAKVNAELVGVNSGLLEQVKALIQKDWSVQVNVAGTSNAQVIGDVNAALS